MFGRWCTCFQLFRPEPDLPAWGWTWSRFDPRFLLRAAFPMVGLPVELASPRVRTTSQRLSSSHSQTGFGKVDSQVELQPRGISASGLPANGVDATPVGGYPAALDSSFSAAPANIPKGPQWKPPWLLPDAARGSQLSARTVCTQLDQQEVEDFPGSAEILEAEWPRVAWEISGVRASGSAFLSNFRLILHSDRRGQGTRLDVGLADTRTMHLEVPIGVVDTVDLGSRMAMVREWHPSGHALASTAFAVGAHTSVDQILLRCLDCRVIRLICLREGQDPSGGCRPPRLLHHCAVTKSMHKTVKAWADGYRQSGSKKSGWWKRDPIPDQTGVSMTMTANVARSMTRGGFDEDDEFGFTTFQRRLVEYGSSGEAPQRITPSEAYVQELGRPTAGWDLGADAGLEFFGAQRAPREKWRLTTANFEYRLCDSYPRMVVVPADANDALLRSAASARGKSRLPVLTYYYRTRGSALLRCSQPKSSGGADAAFGDRRYLECCRQAVHPNAGLFIFDCRSQVAAWANAFKGGGPSSSSTYAFQTSREGDVTQATVISLDVPNIHEMRHSWGELRRLVENVGVPESKWMQKVGETQWLDHCRRITEAAVSVARLLSDGAVGEPPHCVLVHCSDGWDRTSQVCSLAQLLLDKRFRTREGLGALIEKDWRRFGHRFRERSGNGGKASPIFLQWLFCIGALVTQMPDRFEYGSTDLMLLADLSFCGATGTLLFNSEREAADAGAESKHVSLWAIWLQSSASAKPAVDPACANFLPKNGVFRTSAKARSSVASDVGFEVESFQDEPRRASVVYGDADEDRSLSQAQLQEFQPPPTPAARRRSRLPDDSTGDIMLPVTSLKRFTLWEWALRFDEVAFSRQQGLEVVSTERARKEGTQKLGRGLVWMLRTNGAAVCLACKGDFGVFRQKHHCRACGLLFCGACSQWRSRLPPPPPADWAQSVSAADGQPRGPRVREGAVQRVCRRCYELARREEARGDAAEGRLRRQQAEQQSAALAAPQRLIGLQDLSHVSWKG